MRLTPTPVLALLRELWSMPRDMKRFEAYLAHVKRGPDGELFAPVVAANPMAKRHMLAYLDALEAAGVDADATLAAAYAEAERRLPRPDLALRVSLVPIDDVGGAWSERTLMDFDLRFGARGRGKAYPWVTAVVYASETASARLVRERVLAACYRAGHAHVHGPAESVAAMLRQEGRALRFAGLHAPPGLDAVRAALAPHLDATLHATRFAAMYGDAAARRVGHRPLGLPDNAGLMVALADAEAEAPPESWL